MASIKGISLNNLNQYSELESEKQVLADVYLDNVKVGYYAVYFDGSSMLGIVEKYRDEFDKRVSTYGKEEVFFMKELHDLTVLFVLYRKGLEQGDTYLFYLDECGYDKSMAHAIMADNEDVLFDLIEEYQASKWTVFKSDEDFIR